MSSSEVSDVNPDELAKMMEVPKKNWIQFYLSILWSVIFSFSFSPGNRFLRRRKRQEGQQSKEFAESEFKKVKSLFCPNKNTRFCFRHRTLRIKRRSSNFQPKTTVHDFCYSEDSFVVKNCFCSRLWWRSRWPSWRWQRFQEDPPKCQTQQQPDCEPGQVKVDERSLRAWGKKEDWARTEAKSEQHYKTSNV